MARIFITGSTDGIGLLAAQKLLALGHNVLLHARNETRGRQAIEKLPGAEGFVAADLRELKEIKSLANKVNDFGAFDAIIHNAGTYQAPAKEMFAVNTLAPYILTSLIHKPKRLVYISSDLHLQGHPKLEYFKTNVERISYSDTKLHVMMLAKAIAKHWRDVYANAVTPGWVPTKMGGQGAPDDLNKGADT